MTLTWRASSAIGFVLTHHCGLRICSTTSPERLYSAGDPRLCCCKAYEQMGICIGLSFCSTNRPLSLRSWIILFLMWNRRMPWTVRHRFEGLRCRTHLVLAGVLVVRAIVVHQADELEVVPLSTLKIVRVVRRRDLDSTGTELHINGDAIGDDGNATSVEGVNDEFAVEVRVSRIVWVDGNGGISQHRFRSRRGDDDLLVCESVRMVPNFMGDPPEFSIG